MTRTRFPLTNLALLTTLCYALLVIPTLWTLWHCAHTGDSISATLPESWRIPHFKIAGDLLVDVLTALAAWFYIWGYQKLRESDSGGARSDEDPFWHVLLWSGIFALILAFVVPFHSRDVYGYINRGVEVAYYNLNPYTVTLSQIPNWQSDPMFHNHWATNPCPYGFFFTHLASLLSALAMKNFWNAFLLFKSFSALVHIATVWVLYRMAIQLDLAKPWRVAYLYGWNPLILLDLIANGHNDGLLALMLLLALWVILTNRHRWLAWPLLALSVLTKYASILAAPLMAMYFIKKRAWPPLFFGIAFAVLLTTLLGWPFLQNVQHMPIHSMADNAALSQHSINSMLSRSVFYVASLVTPDATPLLDWSRVLFKWMFWGGFAFLYGWVSLSFFRLEEKSGNLRLFYAMLYGIAFSMTVMIAFVSAKFNSWYVGMILPPLLLLDNQSRLRQFGLLLSLAQLLAFTPMENLHVIGIALTIVTPLVLTRYISLFREPD